MVLMLVLLGILCGAFTLNPLLTAELPFGRLRANDLVIFAAFLYAIAFFVKNNSPRFWSCRDSGFRLSVLYLAMIVLMALVSRADQTGWGGNEFIANMRTLLYYGTFFYTIALLRSTSDVRFTLRVLLFYAAAGSVLTIIQSFYGPSPLFGASMSPESDMNSFYAIGSWSQTDSIGNILTRVNLPIIGVILWAFFFTLIRFLEKPRLVDAAFEFLFGTAIFINYSRGLYAGVLLAICALVIVRSQEHFSFDRVMKKGLKLFAFLFVGFLLLNAIFEFDPVTMIIERLLSAGTDISTSSGTWDFRMNELAAYLNMDLGIREILLGFGLFPHNSAIGLPLIHFGFGDLMYRGGVIFSILLLVYVVWSLRYFGGKTKDERYLIRSLSLSLLLCTVTYLVFFVSANQFWSDIPYASMAAPTALLLFVSELEDKKQNQIPGTNPPRENFIG
jgi:hypothetical protein